MTKNPNHPKTRDRHTQVAELSTLQQQLRNLVRELEVEGIKVDTDKVFPV